MPEVTMSVQLNTTQATAMKRMKQVIANLNQVVGGSSAKVGKERKTALDALSNADNEISGILAEVSRAGADNNGAVAAQAMELVSKIRTKRDEIAAAGIDSFAVDLLAAINAGQEEKIVKPLRDFYTSSPARFIKHPILIGPAGCGKTFSVQKIWRDTFLAQGVTGYYETSIYPSIVGADLLGVKIPSGTGVERIIGDFTAAFERAQAGEKVLIFVDEIFRGNSAVQDFLVGAIVKMNAANAKGMGLNLPDGCSGVYTCQAPIFGRIWAPAENVRFIFAGNPWGSALDPAMGNRFSFLNIDFSEQVADVFDEPIRSVIKASWRCGKENPDIKISLPISYRDIMEAQGPNDRTFLRRYFDSLTVIDPIAANLFIQKFATKVL